MGNSNSAHRELFDAISSDDRTFINSFMSKTPTEERNRLLCTKTGWANKTCIHLCAKLGKLRALTAILGPVVDEVTNEIFEGRYPGVAALLLTKVVNLQQKSGRTPFLTACHYGHWNCAQQLLEAGSNVFAVDLDGNSASHLAAVNSHADVVEELLAIADRHAITSRLASIVNLSGFTPLHYAAWAENPTMARQLLAAGVDQLQGSWGEYDRWVVVPVGSTALHIAALRLSTSFCLVMLQQYALQLQDWMPGMPVPVDPRTRVNRLGHNPYHTAIWKGLQPDSQLAVLLNPNMDIQALFSPLQINQLRKLGPLPLRIIAAEAVKHHLLQQLSVLESQHEQHQRHAGKVLQSRPHKQRTVEHDSRHPGLLSPYNSWKLHSNRVASCSPPSGATTPPLPSAAAALCREDVSCHVVPASSNPGQCQPVVAAAAPVGITVSNVSSNGVRCHGAQKQQSARDLQDIPQVSSCTAAAASAACYQDSSKSHFESGHHIQLEQQQHMSTSQQPSKAGLSEIHPAEDAELGIFEHVHSCERNSASCWSTAESQQSLLHVQDTRSVMDPMLAPGSLVAAGSSRSHASAGSWAIQHHHQLSTTSSMSYSQLFSSRNHPAASCELLNVRMHGEPAFCTTSRIHEVPDRSISSFASRAQSRSKQTSRNSSRRGSLLFRQAGEYASYPTDASEDLALFGADSESLTHMVDAAGEVRPNALSYKNLLDHNRVGSLVAATSLAGALPGCVSNRLTHCVDGDVIASFTDAAGLVVGMRSRVSSMMSVAAAAMMMHTDDAVAAVTAVESHHDVAHRVSVSSPGGSGCTTPSHSYRACAHGVNSASTGLDQQQLHADMYPDECGVCFDRAPVVALAGCGHVLCLHCARCIAAEAVGCRAPLCPYCRLAITGFQLLWLPSRSEADGGQSSTAGCSK